MSKEKIDWDTYKVENCPLCGYENKKYKESVAYEKEGDYKIIKRSFICEKCGEEWEAYAFATDKETEKDI